MIYTLFMSSCQFSLVLHTVFKTRLYNCLSIPKTSNRQTTDTQKSIHFERLNFKGEWC